MASRQYRLEATITRRRRDFGSAYKFGDRDAHDAIKECRPFKDPNFQLERLLHDAATQAIPVQVNCSVQTAWYVVPWVGNARRRVFAVVAVRPHASGRRRCTGSAR